MYVAGDRVLVVLSLDGANAGALENTRGWGCAPTGKNGEAPCCDMFQLEGGKVVSFHCYQEIRWGFAPTPLARRSGNEGQLRFILN